MKKILPALILFIILVLLNLVFVNNALATGINFGTLRGLSSAGGMAGALPKIVGDVVAALLSFMGGVALLIVVYGGIMMLTSAGNQEKIGKGKTIIVWAVIGIAVILGSRVLVEYIILIPGTPGSGGAGPGVAEEPPTLEPTGDCVKDGGACVQAEKCPDGKIALEGANNSCKDSENPEVAYVCCADCASLKTSAGVDCYLEKYCASDSNLGILGCSKGTCCKPNAYAQLPMCADNCITGSSCPDEDTKDETKRCSLEDDPPKICCKPAPCPCFETYPDKSICSGLPETNPACAADMTKKTESCAPRFPANYVCCVTGCTSSTADCPSAQYCAKDGTCVNKVANDLPCSNLAMDEANNVCESGNCSTSSGKCAPQTPKCADFTADGLTCVATTTPDTDCESGTNKGELDCGTGSVCCKKVTPPATSACVTAGYDCTVATSCDFGDTGTKLISPLSCDDASKVCCADKVQSCDTNCKTIGQPGGNCTKASEACPSGKTVPQVNECNMLSMPPMTMKQCCCQ